MPLFFLISQGCKVTVKTAFGIMILFFFFFTLAGPVDAFQTVLVRTTDGNVYQIRFLNNNPLNSYQRGNFIDDFSIYNQTGDVELCPGPDDPVVWELYTAARVLAKTRRSTPVYNTDTLAEALAQAVVDQELLPVTAAEKLVVGEIVGHITSEIQSHTFLKSLRIIPKSGPIAFIALPANLIAKIGKTEIRMRKLLYAFWIASTHANTAIVLQKVANQEAKKLWDAINAGNVVDILGGDLDVDMESGEVSGGMSIDGPLRLRLMAGVYQENAERAAELGTDLESDNAWHSWLLGFTGIGGILELIAAPFDAHRLKGALEELETSSGERLADKIEENIEDLYESAAFQLNWHGFCSPDLRLGASYFDVYEGHDLIYTLALDSPPDGVAMITISSDNPDATVSPAMLTFTASDWYKPKTVRLLTIEDADTVNERVYLTHTATGYGEILPQGTSFLIIDRKGNEAPKLVKTIDSLILSLGDELRLDIADYFQDPEGGELRYSHSVMGQNFDVLRVQRDAVGSWITIRPQKVGSTRLHIWSIDPAGLKTGLAFPVTVTDPQNRPPMAVDPIPDQTLRVDDPATPLDLSTYFLDPNGKTLTYTTELSNPGPVLPQVIGSELTISAWNVGSTEVTVKATNTNDLFITQTFTVTVTAEDTGDPSPEPVTQSFDLAIESLIISKDILAPDEPFTLSIEIYNKGPGDSPGPALSYYHSSIQGLAIGDRPQLQGTVLLDPLKAGERITKIIPLKAPSTPRTYYYGAWLAANYGDTDIYNDVATEVGVIVSDTVNARVQLIYWTEDSKIYRSKLDGTQRKVILVRKGMRLGRLALDVLGGKMYWTEFPISGGSTTLKCSNLDGSGIENVVVNIGALTDLFLDTSNSMVYWAVIVGRFEGNKIRRSNLDGSQVEDLVTNFNLGSIGQFELLESFAVDVSGSKMYWTEAAYKIRANNTIQIIAAGKIRRSNLDGSQVENLVTGLSSRAIALDILAGKMYWINNHTSKIQRSNLDGSQIEDLVSAPNMETHFNLSLDVSDGKMYWGSTHIVLRANLDGTEAEILYEVADPLDNIIGDIVFAALPGNMTHAAPSTAHRILTAIHPKETFLLPNYPNPFNPETWIPYQLSESTDVTLSIYSVDGNLVRTLDLGHQAAGIYQSKSRAAYWDGRNQFGEPVASGLYFYTLIAGDFTATRKMLIRK
ncbi:MAG: T9SS type A sorting domain-containing protein [Candidatus Poribacteria bacterium]|nr:T9SS type A sorting domain-containing protein [Candidatus Poribacteria bacterium]